MAIDLSEIIEVIERSSGRDATIYLNAGWVLLETAKGTDESGYPTIIYSLGKTAKSAEPEL